MIVIQRNDTRETYLPLDYQTEEELERVICANPQLLVRGSDSPLHFVARQIGLQAGIMDVLLLSEDGLPVAVEVKLGRNSQARREIVGQLIDYVSALTSYTVDELNEAVEGKLEATIAQMTEDETAQKKIWQTAGTSLRAGMARYILALDKAPADLERIVSFLAKRSNLDIRLVIISKYTAPDGLTVYVPLNTIDESESGSLTLSPNSPRPPSAELQAVIDAYNAMENQPLPLLGEDRGCRQLRSPDWPETGLHYEVRALKEFTLGEIHLEHERFICLQPLLKAWAQKGIPGIRHSLLWDESWHKGKGRLYIKFPKDADPAEVADTMRRLIEATMDQIAAELKRSEMS